MDIQDEEKNNSEGKSLAQSSDVDEIDETAWQTVGIVNRNTVTISGLEPGVSYAVRVRAINSVGPGPWSEVASFRTLMDTYPAAPKNVTLVQGTEGVDLFWQRAKNKSMLYAVYLAVKTTDGEDKQDMQKTYKCIYLDKPNKCHVPNSVLENAHLGFEEQKVIHFLVATFMDGRLGPMSKLNYILNQ